MLNTIFANKSLLQSVEYSTSSALVSLLQIRIFDANKCILDIMSWYDNMPRTQKSAFLRLGNYNNEPNKKKIKRIDQYYSRSHCVVCSKLTDQGKNMIRNIEKHSINDNHSYLRDMCKRAPQNYLYPYFSTKILTE
jgi:hypothetical protein